MYYNFQSSALSGSENDILRDAPIPICGLELIGLEIDVSLSMLITEICQKVHRTELLVKMEYLKNGLNYRAPVSDKKVSERCIFNQ